MTKPLNRPVRPKTLVPVYVAPEPAMGEGLLPEARPLRDDEPTLVTRLLRNVQGAVEKAGESLDKAVDASQAMARQAKQRGSVRAFKERLSSRPPPPKPEDK